MKQKLTIPCELPTLNEIIAESKRHWSEYARTKKQWTKFVAILARLHLKPVEGRVHLSIRWVCKDRRRDPDNVASAKKFIIDGLVEAGILRNDGWSQIEGFTDTFAVDRKRPRVEIVLTQEPVAADVCRQRHEK